MLQRLVNSILKSNYNNIEIIIVDDASTDGTHEFIKEKFKASKKIKLIKNKNNLFTAESRNVGLKQTKGEFIFFIDDDNVLDIRVISMFVKLFLGDERIGELGPVNYSLANKKKMLWSGTNRDMFTSLTNQSRDINMHRKSESWETDDVPNAFMVRADIIKKNKIFFRKYYGIMYEESDFAYRIKQLGFKIKVVRGASIYHDVEEYVNGKMTKDYMYHFMENRKRPYVTARNRIVFHSIFSNKIELFAITTVWIWVFTLYYVYKIIFYSGVGDFSFKKRLALAFSYIKGTFEGLEFVLQRKELT